MLAPLFLLMALSRRSASGLFLSAVNARYRDVPYAIPFLIQIWLYLSGVVYAIELRFPRSGSGCSHSIR